MLKIWVIAHFFRQNKFFFKLLVTFRKVRWQMAIWCGDLREQVASRWKDEFFVKGTYVLDGTAKNSGWQIALISLLLSKFILSSAEVSRKKVSSKKRKRYFLRIDWSIN